MAPAPRPTLAVVVANGITGDSRVQKTALAAAHAGWEVTLVGRAGGKKPEHSWLGPVRVVRLPVGNRMERLVNARRSRGGPRARLTQWGIRDRAALDQIRDAHRVWVREQTTRIGYLGASPLTAPLRIWVRARRAAHRLRVRAYRWEQRRKAPRTSGDWRRDHPTLLDLDLAFGPFIEELAPDVIHANDITTIHTAARAAARLRARGSRCAWLYDAHEYIAGIAWDRPALRSALPAVEREYIHRADAVVTVSADLARLLHRDHRLPEVPAVVRNTPVRAAVGGFAGRVCVRAACGLAPDVPLMVYAGWIAPDRGLATVVEALTELPGHHLALVAGRRSAGLTALRVRAEELGVRHRVHVLPYVPPHQVPDYLSGADLGLIPFHRLPNTENSLPTKAGEYLHARLPIVTSDTRATAAFVLDRGVGEVFTAEDPASFAAAVRRADAHREALRARISDALLTELSWEHETGTLLTLYTRISGRTPGAPLPRPSWDTEERRAAVPHRPTALSAPGTDAGAGVPAEAPPGAPDAPERDWRPLGPTRVRLGLAPANYAGQLAAFAAAVTRRHTDVSAEVVKHRTAPEKHDYPADVYIDGAALRNLDVQLELVHRTVRRYTHLLADAFRPVFGPLNGVSVEGDLAALAHAGIKVALLAHGSEVRDPARHRARIPHSLFRDAPDGYENSLTAQSVRNRRIAAEAGLPVFVTTPDLLLDLPMAVWAPLVVDTAAWACDRPVMERPRPLVVHAPSARWSKGTDRVLPLLDSLHERRIIDFRLLEGVPRARVAELVRSADLVIDQFAIGTYGTFACEGMAAGRPVIAHMDEETVAVCGVRPPIVDATPDTLGTVLERLLDDRAAAARIGTECAAFARAHHDGTATAAALAPFLAP
ncbi:glycosyltransferase [Streptomyces sp. NPDC000594]|uniref:glycosyltransferase n=1 Tax=Streptomyces sp. NPDC000594 TaxID=3154261 RepID=UPI00332062E7